MSKEQTSQRKHSSELFADWISEVTSKRRSTGATVSFHTIPIKLFKDHVFTLAKIFPTFTADFITLNGEHLVTIMIE